jgi:hypothetical protein
MDTPEPTPQPQPPAKAGFLRRIFHHPFTGWVVGIIVSFYFYRISVREPNLTYYVSSTRTPIVTKGAINNLSVDFMGQRVQGDLSSIHIQIWNRGRAPIRKSDILSPLIVKSINKKPFYKTDIGASRDVIGLGIKPKEDEPGRLTLDWNILEPGDGLNVQIIYGGDVNEPSVVEGILVGQNQVSQYKPSKTDLPKTLIFFIEGLLLGSIGMDIKNTAFKKRKANDRLVLIVSLSVFGLMAIGAFILLLASWRDGVSTFVAKPPFGF